MKATPKTIAFLLMTFVALSGCGGGGGGGGLPPASGEVPSDATGGGNTIPPVPTGVPVIYLATSQDASSYFPDADITIEANDQAILRYIPSTGAIARMETNHSPSFAPSTLLPFTQGNRLFSINYSNSVDRFDLYPIDLQTNARTKDLFFPAADPSGCIALVGDDLIFRDGDSWKKLSNVSTATLGENALTIGAATGADRCFFNVGAGNGRLLDLEFIDNTGSADHFNLHERSTLTGAVMATSSFIQDANPENYEAYNFAFDGPYFYLVRKDIPAGTIEIIRIDYTDFANPTIELRDTLLPSASFTGPVRIDVHNGFIAMLVYDGVTIPVSDLRLLTYNDNTGDFQDTMVGRGYYAVQVLFLP